MITDAIFTLQERKGSTRAAIWDYISARQKYQESIRDQKSFFTQLTRLSKGNDFFEKSKDNHQRFKLSVKFKDRLTKLVEEGKELHLAQKQAMTTKMDNPKKPVSKTQKAKMSKSESGLEKLTKIKAKEIKQRAEKEEKKKESKIEKKSKGGSKNSEAGGFLDFPIRSLLQGPQAAIKNACNTSAKVYLIVNVASR